MPKRCGRLPVVPPRRASRHHPRSAYRSRYLWDADRGVFANRFANGTFSPRVAPTSFYALQTRAPSDAQAGALVERWLTNRSRFCVGEGYATQNSRDCYWGLPSISADDPAFPALGYWRGGGPRGRRPLGLVLGEAPPRQDASRTRSAPARRASRTSRAGYVWGPMAQLVYWGLENYAHLPAVARAKRDLARQMTDMFLNMWGRHGHVCENYSPHKNETDCTGDRFYHWGALNGLISLAEGGMY